MSNIKIKYFGNYPVYSLIEDFELPEAKIIDWEYKVIATPQLWGHTADSNKAERNIQEITSAIYQIEVMAGKNLDYYKLQNANHILIKPDNEKEFISAKVEAKFTQAEKNMDNYWILKFWKQLNITEQLSHAFANKMKTGTGVNKIEFDVVNPPYTFNNIEIFTIEVVPASGDYYAFFDVPLNDLTNNFSISDTFYLHTDNVDFNEEEDDNSDFLSFADCNSKTSTYVRFQCSADTVDSGLSYNIGNLRIDNQADWRPLPTGPSISNLTKSFTIYTLLNHNTEFSIEKKGKMEPRSGVKESTSYSKKTHLKFKIWLDNDDLYLAEYLEYALKDNILFTTNEGDSYIPIQVDDIILPSNNNLLIDLHEFNIDIMIDSQNPVKYR